MIAVCLMGLAYAAGTAAALLLAGDRAGRAVAVCAAVGGASGAAAALGVVLSGQPVVFYMPSSVPALVLQFRLDPLGAFFLLLIGLVAVPAAIYGAGYGRDGKPGALRLQDAMLSLFLLSMSLVVMAGNVLAFLMCWEAMSLSCYFLVIGDGASQERLGAGRWYAAMSQAGFGMIAAALFLLSARAGGSDFLAIRSAAPVVGEGAAGAVFLLALLGFGTKAGLAPLHAWLPRAHPAAPSHVSALMSGAMLKMGVYGLIRVALDLLGGGPPWWGGLVLALGAVSALVGVLYALIEQDLKRLLAYSSVENLGIIFMGLGIGMIFQAYGMAALAALALAAALYHALNHAAFKGLLFLGAGAVVQATGTRDMEAMGGLIGRMPQTAAFFLVGAAAIAALPPLNGFVSEWMIFQSLMAGAAVPQPFMAALMGLAVATLALTGGLAAACFVKAFGIPFLAMPRSRAAEEAREAGVAMRLGMLLPAAACVLLGLLPFLATSFLARALEGLPGLEPRSAPFRFGIEMGAPGSLSRISPPLVAGLLVVAAAAVFAGLRLAGGLRAPRVAETWGCGRVEQTPRMEYTSMAFAEPLRRVFAGLYRPTRDLAIGFHPESKYFLRSIAYRSRVRSWFEEIVHRPLLALLRQLAATGRLIQSGSVHLYLTYIVAALLVLLLLQRLL
jgi:hydrogenase-4 component B